MLPWVLAAALTVAPGGADLCEAPGWPHGIPQGTDLDGDHRPNDLHWEDLPVMVTYSPGLAPNWRAAYARAAARVNAFVGGPVFAGFLEVSEADRVRYEVGGVEPPYGTLYVTDAGVDPRRATTRVAEWPDGKIRAATTELPGPPDTNADRVALHELLHVLGVAHDPNPRSVMYPQVEDGPYDVPTRLQGLLRTIYGRLARASNL